MSLLVAATVREPERAGASINDAYIPLGDVVRYILERKRAYGGHILGVSIFIMIVYALNLWGPTYFIRTFEYSRPEAGWVFGLIMILAGTAGLLLAGAVADRLMSRGIQDAYPKVILFSMIGMTPVRLL